MRIKVWVCIMVRVVPFMSQIKGQDRVRWGLGWCQGMVRVEVTVGVVW